MKLKLEQIIELDEAKSALIKDLTLRAISDRPQKLILLEGPSGVGKTTLIIAVVENFQEKYPDRFIYKFMNVYDISAHVTTTSEKIHSYFDDIYKSKKPTILFIDEADEIFATRLNAGHIKGERTTTLMKELNNEIPNLYIIAATNRPKIIDRAVLERFSERINCQYPTHEGLRKLIDLHIPFIDENKKTIIHKYIITCEYKWSGRDMELMADKLITERDYRRINNPEYELSSEDIVKQYNLRINSKKHLKDDYLED